MRPEKRKESELRKFGVYIIEINTFATHEFLIVFRGEDSLHIPSDFEWSEKALIAPDFFVGDGCIVAVVSWAHSVICSY